APVNSASAAMSRAVCVVALVGLTVHRVVATGRRIAHTARDIAALAEFTGAVGRELAAGARAVDAADLALGTGRARRRREVLDRLQVLVREVALGARPADLAGAVRGATTSGPSCGCGRSPSGTASPSDGSWTASATTSRPASSGQVTCARPWRARG
ncbi:hypothetical protein, partial [Corynebacterium bovis]